MADDDNAVEELDVPRAILGAAQAEADTDMLRAAFIETPDYQALRYTSDFNFVVGRRGTGKSALFEKVCEPLRNDASVILLSEQPQDYEMLQFHNSLRKLSDDYRTLRAISRLVWAAAFLLIAVRRLVKHYKFQGSAVAGGCMDFLEQHVNLPQSSTAGIATRLLSGYIDSKVDADQIPHLVAGRFDLGATTDLLRSALEEFGLRIVIAYDRLDEGWEAETCSIAIIGGLAKMAAEYREKHIRVHPILFVRDNMFRALATLDDDFTRHIEGHTLRLHWDEESLFHLVVARLRFALGLEGVENSVKVWNRFAERELQGRSGFAKCLHYTLYRPRDIVVLLNEAYVNAQRDRRAQIIPSDLEKSATRISQNRLEDLFKEYNKVLPGLRAFAASFRSGHAQRKAEHVIAALAHLGQSATDQDDTFGDVCLFENGLEMFSALYSVGFIGVKDEETGNYVFCHDGTVDAFPKILGDKETLVHPCYWKALELDIDVHINDVAIQVNDDYSPPPHHRQSEQRLKRIGRLPEELSAISPGRDGAKSFEAWVHRAIRILFSDTLSNIELKPNPSTSLNQRDIVATNNKKSELWTRLHEDYESRQIVFECKNYAEVTSDDFRQIQDYLTGEYGRIGFIVRRSESGSDGALSANERERIKAVYHDHKKVIVVLPDSMLSLCIRKLRTPKAYHYADHILSKHLDHIVRSVLSLSHAAHYRTSKEAPRVRRKK